MPKCSIACRVIQVEASSIHEDGVDLLKQLNHYSA